MKDIKKHGKVTRLLWYYLYIKANGEPSYASTGKQIAADLDICAASYYRARRTLIEEGYITVDNTAGRTGKTIFRILANAM